MQLAFELLMMEQEPSSQTQSTIVFTNEQTQEADDEDDAVIVVEDNGTLLSTNWIALFVDDVWQREKRKLFSSDPVERGRHLAVQPVKCTRTQGPLRTRPIMGDGNCLFRCISFALWCTEQHYELVRDHIVKHLPEVWHRRRVQYSSRMWY